MSVQNIVNVYSAGNNMMNFQECLHILHNIQYGKNKFYREFNWTLNCIKRNFSTVIVKQGIKKNKGEINPQIRCFQWMLMLNNASKL